MRDKSIDSIIVLTASVLLSISAGAIAGNVNPANMTAFSAGAPAVAAEVNTNFNEQTTQINDNSDRVTVLESATGSAGGMFVHWGSSQPAANSTLLYSGYGFASHYTHSGSMTPVLIKSNAASSVPSGSTVGLLYPLSAWGSSLPPGINQSYIKGAMCSTDKPVTVVWGTQAAPAGTTELYRGYALGPYYQHQGPGEMICVDSVNFESVSTSIPEAALYGVKIGNVPAGASDYNTSVYLECVVVKTN